MKAFKSPQINKFLEHNFDFDNQYKTNYKDWFTAFEKSVAKNAEDNCFTGLSSGYDSGILTNELRKQGFKFKTYTIPIGEDRDIINKRLEKIEEYNIEELKAEKFNKLKSFLEKKIKNDKYIIKYDGVETEMKILDDNASIGEALMCELASKEGRKIYISTQGADEIISDYALFPSQSTYKGKFPDDLKEWENFKKGCNYSYLMKEERIPMAYGIETRFPFIDIDLVQEFLWLTSKLKNRNYKAPLYEYLIKNKIPFLKDKKTGFRVL